MQAQGGMRPPGALARMFTVEGVMIVAVIAVILWLTAVPIAILGWNTLWNGQELTTDAFRRAYATSSLGEMTRNSLIFAAGATLVSTVIGTGLAYLSVRTNIPFRRLIFVSCLVPLIIPGILHTIGWILLAGPQIGLLNVWLEPVFGGRVFNIYSMGGMIFVEGLHLSPLVFLLMYAAFRSLDPSLEESALMSGARLPTIFFRITLPLVKPALFASGLVMMVRGLESFEVPALLGMPDGTYVLTSQIWRAVSSSPRDDAAAGAYAIPLLLLTCLGIFWQHRINARGKAYQTITGKGFRPQQADLGVWRYPLAALVVVYLLVSVIMPLLILIYASTQPFYRPVSMASLQAATLDNYTSVLTDPAIRRAFMNSLILGVSTATAVMFFTAIASWIVLRTKLPGRWLIDNMAFLPITFPGIVLGIAILQIYLRVPLPIYGTLWILFIAYFTRFMPYGMRYASTSMLQISAELEESAKTSGATWWQTFTRVILPLLMPGLLAGWIYIITVSLRELSSSLLIYSPGREVLSVMIWNEWESGTSTRLAALGMVMIGVLVVLVLIARQLGAKIGVRET